MEPTNICGHTYTRASGRKARCTAKPHPTKPDAHYFEWVYDTPPTPNAGRGRGHLIVVPGERRD